MMDLYSIIREPHIAEKGNIAKERYNQVTFKVAKNANKIAIKQAVENIFKTKVVDVKTINVIGKKKRVGRNIGKKPDWKKAIVKLAPGEKIEFFEGM
jgi:large subunit ribosomal protein L23